MFWPSQGVGVFVVMSMAPPFFAIIRGSLFGFIASLLISLLAAFLAQYTYLVPLSAVLLIWSFAAAFREPARWSFRPLFRVRYVVFLVFWGGVAWWHFSDNRSPPEMFGVPREIRGAGPTNEWMTNVLNEKFPHGTDEALLTTALLKQGFKESPPAHYRCFRQASTAPGKNFHTDCPEGVRGMEYTWAGFECGGKIAVIWLADEGGKVTRLQADRVLSCS